MIWGDIDWDHIIVKQVTRGDKVVANGVTHH